MNQILDTSIVILFLKWSYNRYNQIEQKLMDIYFDSQTYKLMKRFWKTIIICFRYSFLGRITEIKQASSRTFAILDNSRVRQYLNSFYKEWKEKIIYYSATSLATESVKDTKEQFNFTLLRTVGVIIVIAIAINVFLALVLQKPIGLWGWLMRGLFVFAATSALFCNANWLTVKENSLFLRKMRMN